MKTENFMKEGEIRKAMYRYGYRNIDARSCNICCSGKSVSIIYILSVYVCSLWYPTANAHAPYYRLWLVRLYNVFFFTLSHKLHDSRKK